MKCIVTGHTSGIGKSIYNHFISKDYNVIGMSRSNGYDIVLDKQKIINEATGCDLFVNCASNNTGQIDLLNDLNNKVDKMIVLGSVVADFKEFCNDYNNKYILQERCKELYSDPNTYTKILHLKLSMCENATVPIKTSQDLITNFVDINRIIDLWIEIPKMCFIEFTFKKTDEVLDYAKERFQS